MKKSVGVLLLLMLLLAVLMAPAATAEEYDPHPHNIFGHCVCNGNVEGHVCEHVLDWYPLEGEVNFGTLESGYYYLTGDVTAISVTDEFIGRVTKNDDGSYTCTQTTDLTICLNGYDITAAGSRVFMGVTQGSSLTITDCAYDPNDTSRGGTVTGGNNANGGIIYTYAKSEFNIYGGNFTAKAGTTMANGGLIVIAQDRGDVPKSTSVEDQYSTFNLYNGHFYGGSAKNGGNFSFMHDVHVNIYGGLIENGTATGNGGNIHCGAYVLLQMHGTAQKPVVIRGGNAGYGGNIYMNHTAATISLAAISNTALYDGTAVTSNGNLRIVGTPELPGVTLNNSTPEVAAVWNGSRLIGQYTTLADAVAAAGTSSANYVQLLNDVTETTTVSGDLYIDLNGHTLSGLTVTGTVYGMDSATNKYDDTGAGSMTVTGTVASAYKSTAAQTGEVYRYLTVKSGSSYSFHRYYMGVTSVVLSPNNDGMGYKATFAGSDTVKAQLQDFGMGVSFDPLAESLEGNIYRTKSGDKFTAGTPFTQKLIVKNILKKDIPENHDYASTPIYARCFIRTKDGTTLFSAQLGGSLMELVENVDDHWTDYSATQKNAVADMLEQYPLSTGGWGIKNAHHHDGQVWKPWTGTWESGGHYYLTSNYTLSSTITVSAGQKLTICLNGYRFQGTSSRMFKVLGTLNIHDHREDDGSYKGKLVSTYSTPVMAPVFYVYENGVMNVSGGNLTYEGTGVMTRAGIGMIGSGDQSSDSNSTEDPAYFNMYYGKIYGGKVKATVVDGAVSGANQGLGGNLDLVNHGVATLYRGTVSGGTATYVEASGSNGMGGNICVSSTNATLNLHSVEITGGSSGVHVISGTVNLYDDVNITGNTDYNLYISNNKTITANNLKDAAVGVTTPGTAVFATVTDSAYADCFTADQPHVWVVNTDGALNICHGHCVCGNCAAGVGDHSCEALIYKAIPTGTVNLGTLAAGNYYLTGDITVTGISNFSNKDVKICLNGYSIKPDSSVNAPLGRVRAGAQLHICDCSGEKDSSGNWTFDGSIYAGTRNYGGVTNVNANGKLYIYGGNFIGTTGNVSGGVFNICNDGHGGEDGDQYLDIYDTQLNMYNGLIQGGNVTTDGGAINSWHHIKVNIYGGTIQGGTAGEEGGNFCTSGKWNIENAVIKNGTATTEGGNIHVSNEAEVRIKNTTVSGGKATEKGGNISMKSNSHLHLGNTTVTGGSAPIGGGVFNYMATVHVSGNTVINNNSGHNLHQFLAKAIDVGTMGSSAKIGVYSEIKGLLLNTTSYTSRFFSEDSNYSLVAFNGNTMYLKKGTTLSYTTPTTFSAGYGEVDISPTENGVPLAGYGTSSARLSTQVDSNGRLYVMTTAVTDKNGNTVLIVACDQIRFTDTVTDILREHMSAATGVPVQNIYINCSHTHSAPDPASTDDVSLRYRSMMYSGFVQSAILAMKDRKSATMQTGSFDLTGPKGTGTLNFTRHYQYTVNGVVKYFGDNFGTAKYDSTTKPVDEPDPTMHLIKFVRSGTDILLCNWRAHPHFTGGGSKTVVSSDYVGPFRDQAESLLGDVEVVFIQGAAGNVNESSRLSSLNHGYTGDTRHVTYGKALAQQLKNNIGVLKTVSTGTVQTKQIKFIGTIDHETDVLIDQAKEVQSTYWSLDTDARKALLAKYGFTSVYHAGAIVARYNMPDTKEMEINVFSIGKAVGFYTVPGELWCSASEEMEAASPFPITFCVGYSLGDYKYFTYKTAWNYESYEGANYRFTVPDTLNKMLSYWKAGLKELYNNA